MTPRTDTSAGSAYPWAGPSRRLLLLIVLISLLACAIAALGLRYVERRLVQATGETLSLSAAEIADKVDRVLRERLGDVRIIASSPVLHSRDSAAMTRFLRDIKAVQAPDYVWLGVTDAQGRILAATDAATIGRDRAETAWFRTVRDGAAFHIADVSPFTEAGGPDTLAFTARLAGPGGEFLGAVTALVGLAELEEAVTQTLRTFQMRAGFSGRLEYQFVTASGAAFVDSEQAFKEPINLLRLGLPSARLSQSDRSGYVEEEHLRRHVQVITGYARTHGVDAGGGVKWGVLVRMNRGDVLAPIRMDLLRLGGLGLLVWLPMLGLTLWAARSLAGLYGYSQEREEWLSITLGSIGDAVIATDRHGTVLFMNQIAQSLTGWQQSDAKGRPLDEIFKIVNENSRETVESPVTKVLREGMVAGLANHTILMARDGTECPIDDSGAPIRDAAGRMIGVVLVFRGIEERRKAEKQMLAEHTVTRILSESASLPEAAPKLLETICRTLAWDVGLLWTIDEAGQHLRFEHGWQHPLLEANCPGFVQESRRRTFEGGVGLPGRVWAGGEAAWIADVAQDRNFPREQAAADAGLHGAFGFPVQVGTDTLGVLEFFSRAPRQPDENLLAMMTAVGRQVGQFIERKEAERALAAEKERLDVTLRSIGDGVIATDAEGYVQLLNAVAETLTGWTQADAQGQPLNRVFHIVDEMTRQPRVSPAEQVLRRGHVVALSAHALLIAKDGAERLVADSGAPIRAHDGTIIGVVLVFRDVTEQAKIERQLLVVKKLESIGVLAGGIAHDFNNILTAVLGNLSLAKRGLNQEDKLFRRLSEAESATLRATGLTQQLLTFSKGGQPLKRVSAIGELLPEWANFVLRGSNVLCDCLFPQDLWAVDIDEGQMSQVVHNLVLNAQQAMPNGGTVTIRGENVVLAGFAVARQPPLPDGRYVKVTIRDQGVGIAPQFLTKIFDPYFTTKKVGSGLGLSTSFSIVKNHEGHLTVESQLGVGTSFSIYLPASSAGTPAPQERVHLVMQGRGRVLIMDDEPVIRAVGVEMLTQCGYEAAEASDGAQALQMYREAKEQDRPFDAVIMDLTIPGGMGGLETLEQLLEMDPQVKAVVSSGYANDPVMADYRRYGFCGMVAKPYTLVAFSQVLYRVVIEEGRQVQG
ncbi:MAG: PAS domain S-box protein [Nitrospirae bacterium]|nr:MAG: PAS domain S-box protein [Nitrospirota bacterium]